METKSESHDHFYGYCHIFMTALSNFINKDPRTKVLFNYLSKKKGIVQLRLYKTIFKIDKKYKH